MGVVIPTDFDDVLFNVKDVVKDITSRDDVTQIVRSILVLMGFDIPDSAIDGQEFGIMDITRVLSHLRDLAEPDVIKKATDVYIKLAAWRFALTFDDNPYSNTDIQSKTEAFFRDIIGV